MSNKKRLSVVRTEPQDKLEEQHRAEELTWRITPQEAEARVHALRVQFEAYRDEINALPFKILEDDCPTLDFAKHRWALNTLESFNPLIKGFADRYDANVPGFDIFDLRTELSDTGFAIGVLVGVIFSGAPKEVIDRFENGLAHSLKTNSRIVKEAL
jgi:hypothetical protein